MAKQTTTVPPSGSANRPRGSGRTKTLAARPGGEAGGRKLATPSLLTFFQESRAELRKVTWPTRQEVTNLTLAVLGMTIGIAAFLGIIDEVLNYIVQPLIGAK